MKILKRKARGLLPPLKRSPSLDGSPRKRVLPSEGGFCLTASFAFN